MLEHRVAGSWLGAAFVAPGGGEGHFWRFTDQHLCRGSKRRPPGELLIRRGRGGVAPLVVEGEPGISLLSNLWLPVQGLGTRQGESRPSGPRVVESECSLTSPSGCQTAVPEWGWQDRAQSGESSWEVHYPSREM